MTTIQAGSIIVAFDGSKKAGRAAQWAAEQAYLERRDLVVVSVLGASAGVGAVGGVGGGAYAYPAVDRLAWATQTAEDGAALARHHRPGLEVVALGLLGDPRRVLVDLSTSAGMLVLGSHGRGPVGSKLLGSVGAHVSKHSRCPVVVRRPGSELMVKAGVLVGADGTKESLPVIEFAFRESSLRDLPLTVLHCYPDASMDADQHRLALAETLAGFGERYPEVRATTVLECGRPLDCLVAASERWNLIVVGRHPAESLARQVGGTISTAVLERSRSAVAVVPEAPPAS